MSFGWVLQAAALGSFWSLLPLRLLSGDPPSLFVGGEDLDDVPWESRGERLQYDGLAILKQDTLGFDPPLLSYKFLAALAAAYPAHKIYMSHSNAMWVVPLVYSLSKRPLGASLRSPNGWSKANNVWISRWSLPWSWRIMGTHDYYLNHRFWSIPPLPIMSFGVPFLDL